MTILTWLPLDAGFASRYTKHLSLEQKGLFLDLYITAIETSNSDPEFLTKLLTLNCSEENNQKVIHLVNHLVSVGFFEYLNLLIVRQINRFSTLRENGKKGGRPNNQKVTIKKENKNKNKKEKLEEKEEEKKESNKEKKSPTLLKDFLVESASASGTPYAINEDLWQYIPDEFEEVYAKEFGSKDNLFAKWKNFVVYWTSEDALRGKSKGKKLDWKATWFNNITRF